MKIVAKFSAWNAGKVWYYLAIYKYRFGIRYDIASYYKVPESLKAAKFV